MTLDVLGPIRAMSTADPAATAIIEDSGHSTSYAAFVARVDSLIRGLSEHGIQRGDRVLFAVRPSTTAIASLIALIEIGAVIVAAPMGTGDELFASQMAVVKPRWFLAEAPLLAAMRNRIVRRMIALRGIALPSSASLRDVRFIAAGHWMPGLGKAALLSAIERGTGRATDEAPAHQAAASDDAFIAFTSGTTARPKAVVHSRRSVAATLHIVSSYLPMGRGDRLHSRDLHVIVPALAAGATVFIPRGPHFDVAGTAAALVKQRITHLNDVTANVQQLLELLEKQGKSFPASLRHLLIGSAPVRASFFLRLKERLSPRTAAWCVYGMTEMLPVAAIRLEDKLAYARPGDIVGAPVDGVTVEVAPNGELIVGGPHLFTRYEGAADVYHHATGDLATLDDGQIVLHGRRKDMIIRGEFNVYPELHEPIIERIAGVGRCALIGVFDEAAADERIVLVVESAKPTRTSAERQALVARIRRELESGPHRIDQAALPDQIVIDELPLAGRSRKVDKVALRDRVSRHRSTDP